LIQKNYYSPFLGFQSSGQNEDFFLLHFPSWREMRWVSEVVISPVYITPLSQLTGLTKPKMFLKQVEAIPKSQIKFPSISNNKIVDARSCQLSLSNNTQS
jgi:hypothetical protein